MASIKNRGDGSYQITVAKGRIGGKQQFAYKTFRPNPYTEKGNRKSANVIQGEVENFARIFEEEVRSGAFTTVKSSLTVEQYIKEWRVTYGLMRLEERTLEDYMSSLRLYIIPQIGGLKLNSITSMHIQSIINKMVLDGKSPGTVKKMFVVARSVFKQAKKQKKISVNPCNPEDLTLPTQKTNSIDLSQSNQEHIFTVEQTEAFLSFVRNPYTATYRRRNGKVYTEERRFPLQQIAYFHVAFYTGARRGELLALTWNDVNWDNRKIDINKAVSVTTKGSKIKPPKSQNGYRVLEMTQQCTEILKEWYDEAKKRSILIDTDWKGYKGKDFDKNNVFITDEGQPMHSTTPYQALKRAVKAYNKNATETKSLPEIRLHDARHTNASLQIALGVSLADTSRNLGHGNVGTTARIYTHGQETSAHTAMKALEDALG